MNASGPSDFGAALVCGGNPGAWTRRDRAHEAETTNGVEAWVFALDGDYRRGTELRADDLRQYDTIILNLNPDALAHYRRLLENRGRRRARVIGLFEGDLRLLERLWQEWSRVADLCDLVICINTFGLSTLRALTRTPVHPVGIPYPVEGVAALAVPLPERTRELFLCARPLERPFDYLAARTLELPMYAFEQTFSRRLAQVRQHRSLNRQRYVAQAGELYSDPQLTILPITNLQRFLERTARSFAWVNLDPRYTWARYVLDAAALGIPIITTPGTCHGPRLFPDLVVESPYDIEGAAALLRRLTDDPAFYRDVTERAREGMSFYTPRATLERLRSALPTEQ